MEAKWGDQPLAGGLGYLKVRFPEAKLWQLSAVGAKDCQSPEGIRVAPALELLRRLA